LVAGHGRLPALHALKDAGERVPGRIQVAPDGDWLVPVIRGISFATEADERAYLLVDNQATIKAGWDDELLRSMLEQVGSDPLAFAGTGFTSADYERLVADLALAETSFLGGDTTYDSAFAETESEQEGEHRCPTCTRPMSEKAWAKLRARQERQRAAAGRNGSPVVA